MSEIKAMLLEHALNLKTSNMAKEYDVCVHFKVAI
jgi:hypothetical protein